MDKKALFSKRTAEILINTGAVLFRPEDPFVLTSGKKSPVYVDCRKLIAFPSERKELMNFAGELLNDEKISDGLDVVAGGETAGIPYAAWVSDILDKPMAYIRKKPKGFGRGARIEGEIKEGDNVLLVEDMTTDGGSKVSFIDAINEVGAVCKACFVVFSYGIFPDKIKKIEHEKGVKFHYLTNWDAVLNCAVSNNYFKTEQDLNSVKEFLKNPDLWQQNNS